MMNRYQMAGAAAYRQGLPLWLNPFAGPKGHAWAVGWGIAWASDPARSPAPNSVAGLQTKK
jgi:hypothetical protein